MAQRPGHPTKPDAGTVDRVVLDIARAWLDELAGSRRALRAAPAGPLRRAVLAARLSEAFDVLAAEAVTQARSAEGGPSWEQVGDAFGIRAQSAHQRFGKPRSELDA